MKIIAHRGARGLELENSLASLQTALDFDVDAIEFDIHRTKDNELVVMHDTTTRRTARQNVRIRDVTLAELQQIQLKNDQQIPTLSEALQQTKGKEVFIDIKGADCAEPLVKLLGNFPDATVTFESFRPEELQRIRELLPNASTYIYFLKSKNLIVRPFHMVHIAKSINATGISIDKLYLLNPLSYYLARRNGLGALAYSVSSIMTTRLLLWLYPALDIITGRPELINHKTFPED